jgi:hypothetical protein
MAAPGEGFAKPGVNERVFLKALEERPIQSPRWGSQLTSRRFPGFRKAFTRIYHRLPLRGCTANARVLDLRTHRSCNSFDATWCRVSSGQLTDFHP